MYDAKADRKKMRHIPVLLTPMLACCAPIRGHWVDATMGAGGFTRALLDAGAEHVTAIDCDPYAHELSKQWRTNYESRLTLFLGNFADLEKAIGDKIDGIVFDLGVSSMQLDEGYRGFSFMRDGPLDMRMSQTGQSAADLVNRASFEELAAILFQYGEERAAKRIAKEIIAARPFSHTVALAECIAGCFPKKRVGQMHPASRSFQALRIAINDELGALVAGLEASERLLMPEGNLAVISFHSLEDRIVKRFLFARAFKQTPNRHFPNKAITSAPPAFEMVTRKAIKADKNEIMHNARSRSARLRIGKRTQEPAHDDSHQRLGLPGLAKEK